MRGPLILGVGKHISFMTYIMGGSDKSCMVEKSKYAKTQHQISATLDHPFDILKASAKS